MKLLGFRIFNYRSIIDSNWCELSKDNISGIIGQNESGKTSVLEALKSFHSGIVVEDIIRSDLSSPKVSCCFSIDPEKFEECLSEKFLPHGIVDHIRKTKKFCLTRHWDYRLRSVVELGGKEVSDFYGNHEETKRIREAEMQLKIDDYLKERNEAVADADKAETVLRSDAKNLENAEELLAVARKEFKLLRKTPNGRYAEEKLNEAKILIESARKSCEETDKIFDIQRKKADAILYQARIADDSVKAEEHFKKAKEKLNEAFNELVTLQERIRGDLLEYEKRGLQHKLDQLNKLHVIALHDLETSKEDAVLKKYLAYKVISGSSLSVAKKELMVEKPHIDPFFTREEVGAVLFESVPEFIFFEDFSSLLPDRIDLYDIFDQENMVEGSRAARNYLAVSGLEPGFFSEFNTRILKQKIEKLNRDVTLNFQEYWSQHVGRKNKITINFELEHYDNSVPEKSGQPYIEFWIRDKNERLYPKQRSRGVRWFLSFYLEIKASALKNNDDTKIMLIDEPGLSLHPRAQEDVLKVFELVKDKIQIIYTTHSPHLIDVHKLYRFMAVERTFDKDDVSETEFFNAKSLGAASADTLLPIYTLLGSNLIKHNFGEKKNNVILENNIDYYFLTAFKKLANFRKEVFFIPSGNNSNLVSIVNILLSWGYDFFVLTGNTNEGKNMHHELLNKLPLRTNGQPPKVTIRLDRFASVEDVLSSSDFKKYVLKKNTAVIKGSNSVYLKENNLSGTILAAGFMRQVLEDELNFSDLDKESRDNIKSLFNTLSKALT